MRSGLILGQSEKEAARAAVRFLHEKVWAAALLSVLLCCRSGALQAQADRPTLAFVHDVEGLTPLPLLVVGRVQRITSEPAANNQAFGGADYAFQWPGVSFVASFRGTEVYFRLGANPPRIRLLLENGDTEDLQSEAPATYVLRGLSPGEHRVTLQTISENRNGPSRFAGFAMAKDEEALPPKPLTRQIEFIGDSHTVGYGDSLEKPVCSPDEVWSSTDTGKAFGALVAVHYGAAFEVNAISGRGVVRNYNGGGTDKLPDQYPYVLFDKKQKVDQPEWQAQVVAVALGTNDFSTPLHPGERWKTRAALQADYERRYVAFLRRLRAKNPGALLLVWTTGSEGGEIENEAAKVVRLAQARGEKRVQLVTVNGLTFAGCNNHPSLADHQVIAERLEKAIDGVEDAWRGK